MLKQVQHDTSFGSMLFHLPLLKILTKEAVVFILALSRTLGRNVPRPASGGIGRAGQLHNAQRTMNDGQLLRSP
jgi:hypothetical protein